MIVEVDARRIRKNHLIISTINNKPKEHKVIGLTTKKCGDTYFNYNMRYIIYEDRSVTSVSLSPSIIGGWIILKLRLSSPLQILFLPLLLNATDKYKYYDYLRIILILIIAIVLFSYLF